MGTLPNGRQGTRVGLRTRRGMKGAVVRNRLKRQLRAMIFPAVLPFRPGVDVVIVIHPKTLPANAGRLAGELKQLCKRAGALS